MKVLIACEFSGVVREAFKARGHDAWSCDLLPTEIPGNHIQGDAREILFQGWNLLIAHPPCTYLCNSGVRWLYNGTKKNEPRWALMEEGAKFFLEMLNAPIPCIAVENPIQHGYAKKIIGRTQSQVIQPWQFGHGEIKATCFWLKGLQPLRPTNIVSGRVPRVAWASPGKDRWKERSVTLPGIAAAMAEQWGEPGDFA